MEETLIDTLVRATGLPDAQVREAFDKWLEQAGLSPKNLEIDDIRRVLVDVLQDLALEIKEEKNPYIKISG